jgi:hypothetical protein
MVDAVVDEVPAEDRAPREESRGLEIWPPQLREQEERLRAKIASKA